MKKSIKLLLTLALIIVIVPMPSTLATEKIDIQNFFNPIDKFFNETKVEENLKDKINVGKILKFTEKQTTPIEDPIDPEDTKEDTSYGYVLGEVLVKYKENYIDLKTESGRMQAQSFIAKKSDEIAPMIIQKLNNENKIKPQEIPTGGIKAVEKNFLTVKENIEFANISVLKSNLDFSVSEIMSELENDSNIEYVQGNYYYYSDSMTDLPDIDLNNSLSTNIDDTFANRLWALENTGQSISGENGTPEVDIDILKAWNKLKIYHNPPNQIVNDEIVTVIDRGNALSSHPDLEGIFWDGNNCKDDNGETIKTEGGCNSGGWNFYNNNNTPIVKEHATQVTGIIAAKIDNGVGVAGVSPNAKIMSLSTNENTTARLIKAINFAKHNGSKIINFSSSCAYRTDDGDNPNVNIYVRLLPRIKNKFILKRCLKTVNYRHIKSKKF